MRVKQMLHGALSVVVPLVDESDIERMTREGGNHIKIRPDATARMLNPNPPLGFGSNDSERMKCEAEDTFLL